MMEGGDRDGRRPLGGHPAGAARDEPEAAPGAVRARADGVRRVRVLSNWTAAALLAGTGVATVALASHALSPASGSAAATSAGTPATGAHGAGGPRVAGPVVTSGGSGVTATVTRVVNGKTVVTHVTRPAYNDN